MTTISMPLDELFEFPSINGLTEEFIDKNPGDIPVYGGRMSECPIGFVNDNIASVKYFNNCLGWNREGSVGYVFWHKDKFTTNDHHRPLILKKKYLDIINLDYVRIILQILLLSSGFSWGKTASKEKVKKMSIEIPTNVDGNISLTKQGLFVKRYSKFFGIQETLLNYEKLFKNTLVSVENSFPQKTVSLAEDCFSLSIGKRVLKKDLLNDGICVYSANPHKSFGLVRDSNLCDFHSDSLIWGIDGNFEWGLIPAGTIFSTTDHCGRLIINDSNILPEYAYYSLRELSSIYGFNRSFRASLTNIKGVSFGIPIRTDGIYDLDAQVKIIQAYKKVDIVKSKLIGLFQHITNPSIDVLMENE